MHPPPAVSRASAPLLWAAVFALPAAAATPFCLPAAAALAALGVLFAAGTRHRCRLAGLCGLPALLASVEPPSVPRPWPRPGPIAIDGVVADVARAPETGVVFVRLGGARSQVRVQFDQDLDLLPGDRLQALGRITLAPAPDLAPGLHGIAATASVRPGPWSLRRAAARIRRALEVQLLRAVPGDDGALLASLVLGRDTLVASDIAAAHQGTGLSHLLAVSGAHAAMLALLLGLRARAHRLGAGQLRTGAGLLLLATYAAITGGDPPVLRAVGTFALAALANRVGRPLGPTAGLAGPAFATLLLQPGALLLPSFLLSYAAVLGLCLAGRTEHAPSRGGLRRWLTDALVASAWATWLTAPLTLLFFGRLAPWTVVLTPLLAPLVAAMLLGGLGIALLGCWSPDLAGRLALPLQWLTDAYVAVVEAADRLPATPIRATFAPPAWALWLAAGGAAAAVLVRPTRAGIHGAVLLVSVPHFVPLHPAVAPSLHLCAVGHGQACLLRTAAGDQVAFDCGSLHAPGLAARRLVATLSRRRLDLLVVTHADVDHHNGTATLLQRAAIARALLPTALVGSPLAELLSASGTAVAYLGPGEAAEPLPGVRVAVPAVPADSSDNDTSAWVVARAGTLTVLLCGDAEAVGVAHALAQGLAVPSDVLILPHHGRSNPMAAALFDRVRPALALVSADAADGDTALGPLARAFGAELRVTGRDGAIEARGGAVPCLVAVPGERPLARPR